MDIKTSSLPADLCLHDVFVGHTTSHAFTRLSRTERAPAIRFQKSGGEARAAVSVVSCLGLSAILVCGVSEADHTLLVNSVA